MGTIPQIAEAMQDVLTEAANRLARETHFVKRERKLTGSSFIQTLVFGFLGSPETTYTDLAQMAATVGTSVSAQALEQRFTETAAKFVQQVLEYAVAQVMDSDPAAIPLLRRFEGVYLRDSTVISLPAELAKQWSGVGGTSGTTAALKLQVEWNYSTGQLHGPVLQSGRTPDQRSPYQHETLPQGALHVADLGYFSLARLMHDNESGVFWVTRLKTGTTVYTSDGERLDLVRWLDEQGQPVLDLAVRIGAQDQVPCRLLALRVPQEVADQRRRRIRDYARKKQVTPKAETLAWAAWTLVITNVPVEQLSLPEALVLIRVRWQIELLFKLWKSYIRVDEWRSQNPWRILCELYAKLIGAIIVHWLSLTELWALPNRSLFKAVHTIQTYAVALALAFREQAQLADVLNRICRCLQHTCKVNRRRERPSASQLCRQPAEALS